MGIVLQLYMKSKQNNNKERNSEFKLFLRIRQECIRKFEILKNLLVVILMRVHLL